MKVNKFLKTIPTKIYLLLFIILVLSFFSNDFGLVDIQKTAIILAIGIDKEEDEFNVTAQISVPKGDRTTGGTSSVEINSSGKTVSDCISHIYSKTGWVPKLVFCDLILLGEEVAKEHAMPVLNYFLRNEYMPDSCFVAVCEGSAKETISSQNAIDDISSQAILKLFSGVIEKTGLSVQNTLKDFSISAMGVSKSGFMPYIRVLPQEESSEGGSGGDSEESGGSGGESGESGSSQSSEKVIYCADHTALFSNGKMVGTLTPEETFAYNLLSGKVYAGIITVENGEKPVSLSILNDDGSVSLSTKGTPAVTLKADLRVQLYDRNEASPIEDMASDIPTDQDVSEATEIVTAYVRSLWETCRTSGCDLFLLTRELYRSSPKLYEEWKNRIPSELSETIQVSVQGIK